MRILAPARAHPARAVILVLAAIAVVVAGAYWFAPQRLFLDRTVNEALPGSGRGASSDASGRPDEGTAGGLTTLAAGAFRGLEHETVGRAVLLELADGRRILRLEGLSTSNGPDLRVYLTDRALSGDWFVWDDGRVVDLGPLKGNVGSSNYRIPADLDLSGIRTAVVWCRRFTIGFGVAPLTPFR